MFSRESSLNEPLHANNGCLLSVGIDFSCDHFILLRESDHAPDKQPMDVKPAVIWLMVVTKQYTQPRPCIQEKDKPIYGVIKQSRIGADLNATSPSFAPTRPPARLCPAKAGRHESDALRNSP
jgi:hypothetical protein